MVSLGVDCGQPPNGTNTIPNPELPYEDRNFESQYMYTCVDGYESDMLTALCISNATWVNIPECNRK